MSRPTAMTCERLQQVVESLRAGKAVRRSMPRWGRMSLDRPLPFVVIYRRPPSRRDVGTERLAVGSASYLLACGDADQRESLTATLAAIAEEMRAEFGAFLVVEVWSRAEPGQGEDSPSFKILHRGDESSAATIDELESALGEIRLSRQKARVSVEKRRTVKPPGMPPLLSAEELRRYGVTLIGVEVAPVYRSIEGDAYPVLVRQASRRITRAISRAAYRFTHSQTTARPVHYKALGKRAVVKAVWDVDERLADIGDKFDLLLQVTPLNTEAAFKEFKRSRYQRAPHFRYRPLPFEPGKLKHALWAVRPERVEDPTLMYLFRDVQAQLDRQISLLSEIETSAFRLTSLQLYGPVEPDLLESARAILERLPTGGRSAEEPRLDAREFSGLLAAEILSYRRDNSYFGVLPEVREDIYSGVLVSRGRVFVGAAASVPCGRADALVQHEIATHVLTYYNASAQPLKLLHVGLPGYEELQEGLAVLGEHLVGGLDAERLRTLAGRVVAVHSMADGAEFVEVFRTLRETGFSPHVAFTIATRVYRGGGLAKDAMYLRGFGKVLDYLAEGADFGRLFLGKYGVKHMPVVDELILRKVLSPPRALPRYLERADVRRRLGELRSGATLEDILKECEEQQ